MLIKFFSATHENYSVCNAVDFIRDLTSNHRAMVMQRISIDSDIMIKHLAVVSTNFYYKTLRGLKDRVHKMKRKWNWPDRAM
jgi:hypothetical protein